MQLLLSTTLPLSPDCMSCVLCCWLDPEAWNSVLLWKKMFPHCCSELKSNKASGYRHPSWRVRSKCFSPCGRVTTWHLLSAGLWALMITSLPANASHLLITSRASALLLAPLLIGTPLDSVLPPLSFTGSTCRTGSPRTNIYNRLSAATARHQAPRKTKEERMPPWDGLWSGVAKGNSVSKLRLRCVSFHLF